MQSPTQGALSAINRLLTLVDKVQAMRQLQRQQWTGISETELDALRALEEQVDDFFMLPKFPHAKAQ